MYKIRWFNKIKKNYTEKSSIIRALVLFDTKKKSKLYFKKSQKTHKKSKNEKEPLKITFEMEINNTYGN